MTDEDSSLVVWACLLTSLQNQTKHQAQKSIERRICERRLFCSLRIVDSWVPGMSIISY